MYNKKRMEQSINELSMWLQKMTWVDSKLIEEAEKINIEIIIKNMYNYEKFRFGVSDSILFSLINLETQEIIDIFLAKKLWRCEWNYINWVAGMNIPRWLPVELEVLANETMESSKIIAMEKYI